MLKKCHKAFFVSMIIKLSLSEVSKPRICTKLMIKAFETALKTKNGAESGAKIYVRT